jgi:hypothetical protein
VASSPEINLARPKSDILITALGSLDPYNRFSGYKNNSFKSSFRYGMNILLNLYGLYPYYGSIL